MSKNLILVAALALVALAVGGALLLPECALAFPGEECLCPGPVESTLVHQGSSATSCAEANAIAREAALREVAFQCSEGTCFGPNLVEVTPCAFVNDWDYVAYWRADFKCYACW